jgi:hypothetical protein
MTLIQNYLGSSLALVSKINVTYMIGKSFVPFPQILRWPRKNLIDSLKVKWTCSSLSFMKWVILMFTVFHQPWLWQKRDLLWLPEYQRSRIFTGSRSVLFHWRRELSLQGVKGRGSRYIGLKYLVMITHAPRYYIWMQEMVFWNRLKSIPSPSLRGILAKCKTQTKLLHE